jgi:hypothetical protein
MISIAGSDPGAVQGNTQYTENIITPLGYASFDYTEDKAKITGRLSGSSIQVTTGEAFDQSDYATTSSGSVEVDYPANYQNVFTANRSKRFFELDYGYNQNTPTNFGLVTQSISNSIDNNFNTYSDPYSPYADIQDYNYYTRAFTDFRYYGSRLSSLTYNTYTSASTYYSGDVSYGKTATIDKIKLKYAYIVDIYTSSVYFPNRSNAQIKYLIDNNSNTLNLTKANSNIFEVQNIFKSGENAQIALFDYDPKNPETQLLTNNRTMQLYEGGFRYSPVAYFGLNPLVTLSIYTLQTPFVSSSLETAQNQIPIFSDDQNYWAFSGHSQGPVVDNKSGVYIEFNDLPNMPSGISTQDIYIPIVINVSNPGDPRNPQSEFNEDFYTTVVIPSGTSDASTVSILTYIDFLINWSSDYVYVYPDLSYRGYQWYYANSQIITNTYVTSAIDYNPSWYATSLTTVKMSATQSLWYNQVIQNMETPGLETPIFPINLDVGDMVKFYSDTAGWQSEKDEYRIVSTRLVTDSTGSFINLFLDRPIDPIATDNNGVPSPISKYIAYKRIPDETNLIIRYAPTVPIIQDGLVYPQYLNDSVKANAGNVVQNLKANNLI